MKKNLYSKMEERKHGRRSCCDKLSAIMARFRRSKNFYLFLVFCTGVFFLWFSSRSDSHDHKKYSEYYESDIRDGEDTKYSLQTDGCDILEFLASHPSISRHSSSNFEKLVCSNKLPLTEASGLSLFLHDERLQSYGSSKKSVHCFYRGILRVEENPLNYSMDCDRKWTLTEKVSIKNKITSITEDGILVTCNDAGTPIYENVHYFIQPLRAQEKRQKFKAEFGERDKEPDKLSVLFIGTDSVSRGSFKRLMPKTYRYLTRNLHAIDLKGFNKVADNTHPNLLAILMGLTKLELQKHKCQAERAKNKFDDCPFIWKTFSEKGYVTIYGEDLPEMWAFHHDSPGFVKEPTDYYLRPYMQVADEIIGHNGGSRTLERNVCLGPKMTMSAMHNYSLKVAQALKDIPYFGFYWITSLTHDLLNAAALADEPSLEFLKRLHIGGYLEHTVLFFVSDHGLRFGDFRSTYAGMLEERLPYVTIVFPEWFKKKYEESVRNVKINAMRLTGTFDLYATLQDIVDQAYVNPYKRRRVTHGQTLFQKISIYRTCEDADIPKHFCSCEQSKEIDPDDRSLVMAAKSTINKINQGLAAFPDCVPLSFEKVLNGRKWSAKNSTSFGSQGAEVTSYTVAFVTKPGGAMMEATVNYQNGEYGLAFDVSRINKFGNQSHCITHPQYKAYCYCKDMLT
ncbi:uncharacterized protein [Palaemon carinicauda]|uniref:uncharacterized protein isoform X2 n=1 Tax=Palaemon carinicauda TaxID=392227 RepID=UPI0035B584D7